MASASSLRPTQPAAAAALEAWLVEVTLSAAAPLCFVAGACLRFAELADRWIPPRRRKRGDPP